MHTEVEMCSCLKDEDKGSPQYYRYIAGSSFEMEEEKDWRLRSKNHPSKQYWGVEEL